MGHVDFFVRMHSSLDAAALAESALLLFVRVDQGEHTECREWKLLR